jgi:hypothetical protein
VNIRLRRSAQGHASWPSVPRDPLRWPCQGSRSPVRLGDLHHPDRRTWVECRAQGLLGLLDHSPFLACLDHHVDRLAIDPGRPLVRLDLPPSLPPDVRSPDLVVEAVNPHLLVLLGGAREGSVPFPDMVCSVPSREASGHPNRLRAPMTAGGLLPSRPVSRTIPAGR